MRTRMHQRMVVPDEAVKYILFQRTAYLRFPVAPVYRFLNRHLPFETPLYNLVVAVESRLRAARVKAQFAADMRREYRSIRDFLPRTCDAVLDIGCGVAGIDIFLARHYSPQVPQFYLLDKSRLEKGVFYMFRARAAFYNSLDVAKQMLTANGVAGDRLHPVEVEDTNEIQVQTGIDLVISLLAWGFHFPVETYLAGVQRVLSEQGVIILDVRKGTDGIGVLRRNFRQVRLISDEAKYERVAVSS